MFCRSCGKQLPDSSDFCPECGTQQNSPLQSIATPQKIKKPIHKRWWFWVIAVVLVVGILGNLGNNSEDSPDAPAANIIVSSTPAEASTPTPTPTPTPTLSPEEQAALDAQKKADFIASCVAANYKDLLRTPDDYVGTNIMVTVGLKQIMSDWLSDEKSYRCYSDTSGYGWYLDDEYYIADYRGESAEKLLVDDIIVIYGEYVGIAEITRALTGTNEEIPQINMYYAERVSE